MSSTRFPSARIALVVFTSVLLALPVAADEGKQEAKAHFTKGEQLFDQGRFAEAAREFNAAYKLAPHPQVLYNIATCYEESGDIPAAVVTYRRYIAEAEDTSEITTIKQKLAQLEQMVGEVRVGCALSPCRVRVDGEDRGEAPLSVVISPGKHELEALYNGHVVDKSAVGAEAGKKVSLTLALEVDPADYPVASEEEPEPEVADEPIPSEPEDGVTLGAPFWIAAGVTVAAGATTAVFGVMTLKDEQEFEDSDRLDEDIQARGERDRLITNIMIGVTAAAGATALAFAIHDVWSDGENEESESGETPAVSIAPYPGVGLTVSGVF